MSRRVPGHRKGPVTVVCPPLPRLSRALSLPSSLARFPVSLGNLQPKASPPSSMYPGNKKKKLWREEKERLLKLTQEERRKEYKDYVPLDKIPSFQEDMIGKASDNDIPEDLQGKSSFCEKVSLYQGDITQLEVDAIVNAGKICYCVGVLPITPLSV
uniref:Uncharacterized protein n=1 Tax=Leptobrachium leishanense TaxID=445787 RepID=A0A8C5M572_9ANUR